jgi:hypothetical protein
MSSAGVILSDSFDRLTDVISIRDAVHVASRRRNIMNRRRIISISALTALGLALSLSGALAQTKSLKDQLVGTWTLVSADATLPDGAKQQGFGAKPKGILILDAGGRYALVQGNPDRPKFKDTSNLRLGATNDEFAAAARSFAANFGSWSVDEAGKTLIRKYEIALIPNNDAQETKDSVSLSGDDLKLDGTLRNGARTETIYRRAK